MRNVGVGIEVREVVCILVDNLAGMGICEHEEVEYDRRYARALRDLYSSVTGGGESEVVSKVSYPTFQERRQAAFGIFAPGKRMSAEVS